MHYQTTDLSLAAFLSLHTPLEYIDKNQNSRATFFFSNSKETLELVEAYWNRKAQVEPQNFFQQIKYLKTRIYNE